ncbi:MAG: site-2 protease family protein [Verrucomicrobiota bacterium]
MQFTLFGTPVRVQPIFWVVIVILGPIWALDDPGGWKLMLVWVPTAFVSILVHELGHAFYFRKAGGRPSILLYGMGGLATATGRFQRRELLWITAGGPLFGFALAGMLLFTQRSLAQSGLEPSPLLVAFFVFGINVNVFWTLLNLMPIEPLDGGQFLRHWMREGKQKLRSTIGAVTAGGLALAGLAFYQSLLMGVLFGYLAWTNWQAREGEFQNPWNRGGSS